MAVIALVAVGTLAAYLPVLHKLPVVGAPRLSARLFANSAPDLKVTIPTPSSTGFGPQPSVLIRVNVKNDRRADVTYAMLNMCVPIGHGLRVCDGYGEPIDEGKRMPPTQEVNPFDYWSIDGLRFTGRNAKLFHFRIRVAELGEYPLKLRIQSNDFYEELVLDGTLVVSQANGDLSPRDLLSRLIDEGETAFRSGSNTFQAKSYEQAAANFVTDAILNVQRHFPEMVGRFDVAEQDYAGPSTGDDYYRALITSYVRTLYDIRDHVPVLTQPGG